MGKGECNGRNDVNQTQKGTKHVREEGGGTNNLKRKNQGWRKPQAGPGPGPLTLPALQDI